MKKYILFLFIIFCIDNSLFAFSLSLVDSIGLTSKNGSKYIIHQVDAGETLFALSRKYDVEVQAIKNANTESVSNLAIGQKILIPIKTNENTDNSTFHNVKPSETLFSVSRQYNVTVDEIVKWNNLTDNSISVGQKLRVSDANSTANTTISKGNQANNQKTHTVTQSQTLYSVSRMYNVTMDQLKSWNNLTSVDLSLGQVLIVSEQIYSSNSGQNSNSSMLPSTSETVKKDINNDQGNAQKSGDKIAIAPGAGPVVETNANDVSQPADKIVQKGFAEVIDNGTETKKYLALHRDAPQGTIMQVRNEMNNQSVFVRIVGTIPPTGDNSKVILKISKKAYDRLGAVDSRFPIELSYIP